VAVSGTGNIASFMIFAFHNRLQVVGYVPEIRNIRGLPISSFRFRSARLAAEGTLRHPNVHYCVLKLLYIHAYAYAT
jgi:hypothetical protein